jgi:hypothetical protein
MRIISALVFCLFLASPAWAEEILYCSDTAKNGFKWDKDGNAKHTLFNEKRFTVKVISETQRVVSQDGFENEYTCSKLSERYHCRGITGFNMFPIIFGPKGFTSAFLQGPPLGGNTDPNIWVAYGTCTKF